MLLQKRKGKLEIIDKRCYYYVTTEALKVKIKHFSGRICLRVYMKLSIHSIYSERLTQVYKDTSPRDINYIDLKWGYMGQLALKSFK